MSGRQHRNVIRYSGTSLKLTVAKGVTEKILALDLVQWPAYRNNSTQFLVSSYHVMGVLLACVSALVFLALMEVR